MRTRLVVLLAALSLSGGISALNADASTPGPVASTACTHARIDGKSKCLQRGQFCKHASRSQYPKYGYHCNKRDRNGRWHLT